MFVAQCRRFVCTSCAKVREYPFPRRGVGKGEIVSPPWWRRCVAGLSSRVRRYETGGSFFLRTKTAPSCLGGKSFCSWAQPMRRQYLCSCSSVICGFAPHSYCRSKWPRLRSEVPVWPGSVRERRCPLLRSCGVNSTWRRSPVVERMRNLRIFTAVQVMILGSVSSMRAK